MKIMILFCLLITTFNAYAEKLRYFVDKKTELVGVKNSQGKIIIPAQYHNRVGWGRYQEPIANHEREIEFLFSIKQPKSTNPLIVAGGDVYDRKGKYLYSPLWFDMGLDYWIEGRRRFVENHKVGFVNRKGEKVIPAQYQAVSSFWNGYAAVYVGHWRNKYADNGDYKGLEPADETGKYQFIDYYGNVVSGSLKRQSPTDIEIEGKFFPCYLKKCDQRKSFY